MAEPAKKEAAYDDLFGIPENMTGEIINGELIVAPRPSRRHVYASTSLSLVYRPISQDFGFLSA